MPYLHPLPYHRGEVVSVQQIHPGDKVDHYQIERVVASGGMASIFRAIDVRTGQPVALKVPHLEAECDPVFFDRFRREIEIGKKLNHPAVVRVLDDQRHSRVYMVSEWVEGRLLRHILGEERPLPVDRAVGYAMEICAALDYLHCQGVVHRDLKPENIMADSSDRVKIIDFGIASNAGSRRLTFGKLSHVMGSPDYISPEQVKGKRGDGRSDLYALGVMLYEMLTGQVPFDGTNPFVVMNARLSHDPAPPRELNPRISPQLQAIVCRALARDPQDRYARATELAWDLSHQDQVAYGAHPFTTSKEGKKQGWGWLGRVLPFARHSYYER
jgi:serine/threonine protein kinase